ncbi:MAG: DNA polymerase III subunit delta' [Anaerovibrio sp.]|nr:DNA polymerase III subunit delta' [Selenomonadaceae bacterium]MDD6397300.1 DNA polymerase III subunit delta' [Selenomonadaceae bacterium]MDY6052918.1 DNA polymerase III subunit delta' [Anaerovibrio sp.]
MEIQWNHIIGHKRVIEQLQLMQQEDRVPHTMLFSGAAGIGKLLVARSLAALLLCHEPQQGHCCGQCPACQAMANDIHPDFFYVEPENSGKTSRIIKIEQIRAMQADIARVPVLSKRQVVIINDAEKLNEAAANSLLKTIEEPSGQTVFILITSAPMALLDTVRSRCMRVEFGILQPQEIEAILQKKQAETDLIPQLAAYSDGSAAKALELQDEKMVSLQQDAMELIHNIEAYDVQKLLQKAKDMASLDKEQLMLWLGFLAMLYRDLLILHSGSDLPLYNQDKRRELVAMLEEYFLPKVFKLLHLVRSYQKRLNSNVSQQLMLEGLLIRMKDIVEE